MYINLAKFSTEKKGLTKLKDLNMLIATAASGHKIKILPIVTIIISNEPGCCLGLPSLNMSMCSCDYWNGLTNILSLIAVLPDELPYLHHQ